MIPIKGPQGQAAEHSRLTPPEPQEKYEEVGGHPDLCTEGIKESFEVPEDNHNPYHPKPENYLHHGRG